MKIAVNTRLLIKNEMDGIGLFTHETFKEIVRDHPEIEFLFIFDRPPHADFVFADNITPIVLKPKARHPLLYKVWYQVALKRTLRKHQPDIFVGTDGMIPLKTNTKTLAVIHDLNFVHYPDHLPTTYSNYYQKFFPKFAHTATRIATVSAHSKQDIISSYGIDESKIDVVYNGANAAFKPIEKSEQEKVKTQYSSGQDYFLFIGSIHPRKNLNRLFEAFAKFKAETNSPKKLVVVGKKMWWSKDQERAFNALPCAKDIVFTGRLPLTELVRITASAYALTYVPLFEGFGIPIVEAMSAGTPVITSNVTSMPEVAGDAGILVDPTSVDAIAKALTQIDSDKALRTSLAQKSLEQAKHFSWKRTASLLWDSINKTLHA